MPKLQKFDGVNDVGGIFVGWGMSIASKRAKERQKRTPDELVMVKTVKRKKAEIPGAGHPGVGPDFRDLMSRTLRENALQEPDVRGMCPDVRAVGAIFSVFGKPEPDIRAGDRISGGWPDVRAGGRMSGLEWPILLLSG